MDGRPFANFHVDIAVGDVLIEPLEDMEGRDWLKFAGIPAAAFRAISAEQQFAEKLHAYTLPRQHPNSRVRDLIDMVLLIESDGLEQKSVKTAIQVTFHRRQTHSLPKELAPPPTDWSGPFAAMAAECGIGKNVSQAFDALKSFLIRVSK